MEPTSKLVGLSKESALRVASRWWPLLAVFSGVAGAALCLAAGLYRLRVHVTSDEPGGIRAAIFRAVETGRPMVVANNPGISTIIDACGRVRARTRTGIEACLNGVVHKGAGKTLYVRLGDAFCWLCVAGIACAVSAGIWRSVWPGLSLRLWIGGQ